MTLYSELMGDHMTCNDIITHITKMLLTHYEVCTHYHIHSHERRRERVHTFLGLAGVEWGTVVARRPD